MSILRTSENIELKNIFIKQAKIFLTIERLQHYNCSNDNIKCYKNCIFGNINNECIFLGADIDIDAIKNECRKYIRTYGCPY